MQLPGVKEEMRIKLLLGYQPSVFAGANLGYF